jgi:hypothetical protein
MWGEQRKDLTVDRSCEVETASCVQGIVSRLLRVDATGPGLVRTNQQPTTLN